MKAAAVTDAIATARSSASKKTTTMTTLFSTVISTLSFSLLGLKRRGVRLGLSTNKPRADRFKKRHWLLGTSILFACGWVTHTTTANIIEQQYQEEPPRSYSLSSSPEVQANIAKSTDAQGFLLAEAEGSLPIEAEGSQSTEAEGSQPIDAAVVVPELRKETHTIKRGEFLGSIFRRRGYPAGLPYTLSKDPIAKELVSLKVGREIEFGLDDENALRELHYPVTNLSKLSVRLDGNQIIDAQITDLPYQTKEYIASAEIKTSLYEAALEAGLSNNLIMEMVRIFGWDIDFVLDIRKGDTFHIVYTQYELNNEVLQDGNILAAEFTTQGTAYRALRFENEDGDASYYAPNGESMLGTFLRSPVEFSRISSRFGKRKHPILKTWRAHKGVDYAAGRGTPIRATADGKVTLAGNKGGYGRTIVIRHAGRFSTLYAHMTGFAKGIRSGSRVKQGQTIGYVGSTGLATGPHLHYEFRVDGVHRNPLSYKTPKASSVPEALKASFDLVANKRLAKLDEVSSAYMLAQNQTSQRKL